MTRRASIAVLSAAVLAGIAGACAARSGDGAALGDTAPETAPARASRADCPRVVVLGTAQDGGVPHVACSCANCERARRAPAARRRVASLAVILPESRRAFLVDATPDLPAQLEPLVELRRGASGRVERAPFDGVFLTHAHMGHYLGLAWLGYEALHTRALPLYCSSRMGDYLKDNGPWSQLVRLGNVELRPIEPGVPVGLGDGVAITPLRAPHRDEFTDTLGFLVRGPASSVLFVPDTDGWAAWSPPIEEWLARADVALLDGTFFSLDELPGRDVASIGHPLIRDSLERFAALARDGSVTLYFTHLNHSNPALDPSSAARREIEARGFRVLEERAEFCL